MYFIKRFIYLILIRVLRTYWRISGGRKAHFLKNHYMFMPKTELPLRNKYPIPKDDSLSDIVKYTDYVQMRSITHFVEKLTQPPYVIDIGAYHGNYAVIIGKLIQPLQGKLIAIEPDPKSFDMLNANVKLNKLEDTVICENIAISDKEGYQQLFLGETQSSFANITGGNSVQVKCRTVKHIIEKYPTSNIDLVIIDTEGYELQALKGIPWNDIKINKIFCELHPYAWEECGYDEDEFFNFLRMNNLSCMDMYLENINNLESNRYIGPTLINNK